MAYIDSIGGLIEDRADFAFGLACGFSLVAMLNIALAWFNYYQSKN